MGPALGATLIVTRYIARGCARAILLSLACLCVVLVVVELVEQAGPLGERASLGTTAELCAWFAAAQALEVWPVAMLLGFVIIAAVVMRNGEWLGALGAGIDRVRFWAGAWAILLAYAALGVAWGEWVVPAATLRIQTLVTRDLGKASGSNPTFARRTPWLLVDDTLLYLPASSPDGQTFRDPFIVELEGPRLRRMIEAERMTYDAGRWRLEGARVRDAIGVAASSASDAQSLRLDASPADLTEVTGHPRHLGSLALHRLIERRRRAGLDTTLHELEAWQRFAHPLSGVWMAALAAAWLRPSRQRTLAQALGAALAVTAWGLAIAQLGRVLALGGSLSPLVGVWGPAVCTVVLAVLSGVLARSR